MKKKNTNPDIDGYSKGHLSQLIRRNMIQKDHGNKNKYNRKDKSWKKDLNND